MFSKHVTKLLSAYAHEELPEAEAFRVKEHLAVCQNCRIAFEEITIGISAAKYLQVAPAPSSLWPVIVKELNATQKVARPRVGEWKYGLVLVAGVIGILLIGGWYAIRQQNIVGIEMGKRSWEVARITGAPKIGNTQIQGSGSLAVGEWLETDNASSAQVKVASIGFVDIDPNSRVQLVQTTQTEHRINLMKGKMSAFIIAPPRLFFVDTPSATAVDLGCAYTLEVDEYGASLLHVTSGWVSLLLNGRESSIPAGAMCATRKGIGVGTPYFADASMLFKATLTKLDFEPLPPSQETSVLLNVLLSDARTRDAITLWHLLGRQFNEQTSEIRGQIFDRLTVLVPPPGGITRQGIINGNNQMLELWWIEKIR